MNILKNPAYAGAYVYGRTTRDPLQRPPGQPGGRLVRFPIDKWPILLHNRYPAYITWDEFLANQAQLQANLSWYGKDKPGVPRTGQALLQGMVRCGRCGTRMAVHYAGPQGKVPVYTCLDSQRRHGGPRCQYIRALPLDAEIERLVLEALAPDQLALALAALEQLEQEEATLRQQWQLRLERARYEATRARRQFDAVEPENRLVARNLERQWEDKLRDAENIEHAYQTWSQQQRLNVTPVDRQHLLALGEDLPAIWHAPTTTAADRKRLLRLVVKDVVVDQHRGRGQVWFQINWQTGATSEHCFTRRVSTYADYARLEELQQRLRELTGTQQPDDAIAHTLNAEGFCNAHGQPFTGKMIWLLRKKWDLPARKTNLPFPLRWQDGSYSVAGVAAAIGVQLTTVYKWLKQGRLQGQQSAPGLPWKIFLTKAQLASLQRAAKRIH